MNQLLLPYELSTLHKQESSIRGAPRYEYDLFFSMHTVSMANRFPSFKPTRATSSHVIHPDNYCHRQHRSRNAKDVPLVPISISRPFVKRKSYEVDTGIPPSKKFKPPTLERSRLFSQRWILLPPEELAKACTHPYSLGTPISLPQSPHHRINQSTLPQATYKQNRNQTYTMPYNNTAIPPPEEITGAASLPC